MPKERPLGAAEKGMGLYIGSAGAGTDAAELVFDKEFSDEGFTETKKRQCFQRGSDMGKTAMNRTGKLETYFEICGAPACSGNGTSSLKILANVAFRFLPLNGVVP